MLGYLLNLCYLWENMEGNLRYKNISVRYKCLQAKICVNLSSAFDAVK